MHDLIGSTSAAWAAHVLAEPLALLDDHAHLERNAATNALELVRRPSFAVDRTRWVERLTSIARDEVEHLGVVNRELAARDATLSTAHRNPYAAALRELVRRGAGHGDLVDRLLVSGLIEARSHDRFVALAAAGHELSPLYAELAVSEAGHHRVFVQLAEHVAPSGDVTGRWEELAVREAEILAVQPPGPKMHSGEPD